MVGLTDGKFVLAKLLKDEDRPAVQTEGIIDSPEGLPQFETTKNVTAGVSFQLVHDLVESHGDTFCGAFADRLSYRKYSTDKRHNRLSVFPLPLGVVPPCNHLNQQGIGRLSVK